MKQPNAKKHAACDMYEYTKEELTKLHIQNFKKIASCYLRGLCVGEGSWQLRVNPSGKPVLVTRYRIATDLEGKAWSGINEFHHVL